MSATCYWSSNATSRSPPEPSGAIAPMAALVFYHGFRFLNESQYPRSISYFRRFYGRRCIAQYAGPGAIGGHARLCALLGGGTSWHSDARLRQPRSDDSGDRIDDKPPANRERRRDVAAL